MGRRVLDAQVAECRRHAARQGWAFGSEFQGVMSGKRDDRPRNQALLAEVLELPRRGERVVPVRFAHAKYRAETMWTPLGEALWGTCEAGANGGKVRRVGYVADGQVKTHQAAPATGSDARTVAESVTLPNTPHAPTYAYGDATSQYAKAEWS